MGGSQARIAGDAALSSRDFKSRYLYYFNRLLSPDDERRACGATSNQSLTMFLVSYASSGQDDG
jgi:hypothetical protein